MAHVNHAGAVTVRSRLSVRGRGFSWMGLLVGRGTWPNAAPLASFDRPCFDPLSKPLTASGFAAECVRGRSLTAPHGRPVRRRGGWQAWFVHFNPVAERGGRYRAGAREAAGRADDGARTAAPARGGAEVPGSRRRDRRRMTGWSDSRGCAV